MNFGCFRGVGAFAGADERSDCLEGSALPFVISMPKLLICDCSGGLILDENPPTCHV
jgi:hypothetical protein